MDNNAAAPPSPSPVQNGPAASNTVQGKKLLVVEDDFYMNDLYKIEGTAAGFLVETAVNGVEGIEKVQSFVPDIILLDLMLPKADGIQVTQTIRTFEQFKTTPIVIITNVDETEIEKRARDAGVTDYLLKIAFTPDQVTQKLKSYFS